MREKLLELIRQNPTCIDLGVKNCRECQYGNVEDCHSECLADHLMANNVVPVVRCKDCKFSSEDGGYDSIEQMRTHLNCRRIHSGFIGCAIVPKEGFCSYGERKDNEG